MFASPWSNIVPTYFSRYDYSGSASTDGMVLRDFQSEIVYYAFPPSTLRRGFVEGVVPRIKQLLMINTEVRGADTIHALMPEAFEFMVEVGNGDYCCVLTPAVKEQNPDGAGRYRLYNELSGCYLYIKVPLAPPFSRRKF